MSALFLLGKWVFLVVLVIFHFFYFAIPAYRDFTEASVAVEEFEEDADHLIPPAITLCPYKYWFSGWRNGSQLAPNFLGSFDAHCSGAITREEILDCIEKETFNITDALPKRVWPGIDAPVDLSGNQFWTTDFTAALDGRCFTLNYTQSFKADIMKDGFLIDLNPDLAYLVYVHQPDFFLVSYIPLTMPTLLYDYDQTVSGKDMTIFLFLQVYREEKLNRKRNSCNKDKNYNFKKCIRNTLSKEIGCKLPWDTDTTGRH